MAEKLVEELKVLLANVSVKIVHDVGVIEVRSFLGTRGDIVKTLLHQYHEKNKKDPRPISESCGCPACRNYSRAYIRHLLKVDEMLGMRLCVLHNLYFYNELMAKIREALDNGCFESFYRQYVDRLAERV